MTDVMTIVSGGRWDQAAYLLNTTLPGGAHVLISKPQKKYKVQNAIDT